MAPIIEACADEVFALMRDAQIKAAMPPPSESPLAAVVETTSTSDVSVSCVVSAWTAII